MYECMITCTVHNHNQQEVRPGKRSFEIDGISGSDFGPRITIVASEERICLPLPTRALRDKLLARLQAFLTVYGSAGSSRVVETSLPARDAEWSPAESIKKYFGK